jgi:hypothetical protein
MSSHPNRNFRNTNPQLVPPPLRVLVVSAVNVPWNTFLSLQAAKGAPAAPDVKQVYAD